MIDAGDGLRDCLAQRAFRRVRSASVVVCSGGTARAVLISAGELLVAKERPAYRYPGQSLEIR